MNHTARDYRFEWSIWKKISAYYSAPNWSRSHETDVAPFQFTCLLFVQNKCLNIAIITFFSHLLCDHHIFCRLHVSLTNMFSFGDGMKRNRRLGFTYKLYKAEVLTSHFIRTASVLLVLASKQSVTLRQVVSSKIHIHLIGSVIHLIQHTKSAVPKMVEVFEQAT